MRYSLKRVRAGLVQGSMLYCGVPDLSSSPDLFHVIKSMFFAISTDF